MAKVHFRTNVLLKSIIGKDLITDDNIAVLELVKNSFDANSEKVTISFANILSNDDEKVQKKPTHNTSQIIISDLGIGMNEDDIKTKWLNIAYSEKKVKREEYGRVLAGNKGVGRFSCDKLGEFLNIYTRKKNGHYNHLFIDWKKFEVENEIDLDIQKIALDVVQIPANEFKTTTGFSQFQNGTILQILKLREHWDAGKILGLRQHVEKLINPNQAFKKNTFDVEIIAPEFRKSDKEKKEHERINGLIKNRIFEKLNFRTTSIESSIDKEGEYITTVLQDRGNEIFTLKEKNPFNLLKDINLSIYYLNPYAKAYFTRQTGIRSIDFGSIFLFVNGFRIPPYGDQGDDWLGLEIRKGQGHSRFLGTREIVGRISVNDELGQFKIISSRAGIVNDATYTQLTKDTSPYGYFYKIFRRLERFVVEGIKWDSVPTEIEKNLEETISQPSWKISQEKYNEDSLARNRRAISVIKNIIDHKRGDIIDLKVNESFIQDIIEEQSVKARKELESIFTELKSKQFTPDELMDFLKSIEVSNKDLYSFAENIATYAKIPTKKLETIRRIQKEYEEKYLELKTRQKQLEEKLKEEEEERKRLENELEAEKKETLFHKKIIGSDIKEIVSLQHHIDRAADKINKNIVDLINGINNDLSKNTILKFIERISLESKKISSVVQFVTNANFNLKATTIKKDVSRFIREYVLEVHQEYEHLKLNKQLLKVNLVSDDKPFIFSFRPIEIVIIIDNLFSNSYKAKAKNIELTLKNKVNSFEIIFKDDGNGITNEILPRIFNLGFTTTVGGSGIGLFHVKQIIDSMKGTIEVNNNIPKGVQFKITLHKNES